MTLPQRNATLLQVNGAGGTPDWDSPDAAGPQKFKGRAAAYYNEKRGIAAGPSQGTEVARDLVTRRHLIVEAGRPGIEFEEDDVVRYMIDRRRGGRIQKVEVTSKVGLVEEHDMPGQSVLGTVRLTLQQE